jgi:hypothetical protein
MNKTELQRSQTILGDHFMKWFINFCKTQNIDTNKFD